MGLPQRHIVGFFTRWSATAPDINSASTRNRGSAPVSAEDQHLSVRVLLVWLVRIGRNLTVSCVVGADAPAVAGDNEAHDDG